MTVVDLFPQPADAPELPAYDGPVFGWPCTDRQGMPRVSRYVPVRPHPVQLVYLSTLATEVFFGGAAGGAKSSAMLMAALQFVDVPGYAALIMRKTYKHLSLPGALIERASSWLAGTDARWSQQEHTWHFPAGSSLTFGFAADLAQARQYQSAEFQFVGIDESTDIGEAVYRFMFTRLRAAEQDRVAADGLSLADVPIRVRPASNPGGPGHGWHKARFIDDASRPRGVVFLPSKLEDNPSLDAERYERQLRVQDPVNWLRYRFGDWEVRNPGQVFDRANITVVAGLLPGVAVDRCRRWDLASTELAPGVDPDWTVGVRVARDRQSGLERVEDMVYGQWPAAEVERVMARTAKADGVEVTQVVEQEPGASGKLFVSHVRRRVMVGVRVEPQLATGEKELRIRVLIPTVENRELTVVAGPWNAYFLDQIDGYPDTGHDDVPDALAGAHLWLAGKRNRIIV